MRVRILGLDPGLRKTGWGVLDAQGNRLSPVAAGTVTTPVEQPLAARLYQLYEGLHAVLELHKPDEVAVEDTVQNRNPTASLKLGQARGVALLVGAQAGLSVAEYLPTHVKKSLTGTGKADKDQVAHMVRMLLPGVVVQGADATDALAVAICHAHNRTTPAMRKAVAS